MVTLMGTAGGGGQAIADRREAAYRAAGTDCYLFTLNEEFVIDATQAGTIARFTVSPLSHPPCVWPFSYEVHDTPPMPLPATLPVEFMLLLGASNSICTKPLVPWQLGPALTKVVCSPRTDVVVPDLTLSSGGVLFA